MRRRDLIERGRIQARGGPTAAANAAPAPAPPPAAVAAPHSAKRRKTPTAAKKNASFGSPSAVRSPLAAINLNDSRFKGPTAGRAGSGSPRVRSNLSKSSFGSPVVVAPPSAGPTRTTNIIAPAPSLMRDLGMQSPRTVDMMDAEMPYDEDMDFGAQESFGDWLGRCGLRGPADANSAHGSVKISQKQRDELEHVWCNAAEADTLRRLVENLKDSELDIARREQLAKRSVGARLRGSHRQGVERQGGSRHPPRRWQPKTSSTGKPGRLRRLPLRPPPSDARRQRWPSSPASSAVNSARP
jgi:hypothetical protein